MIGIIIVIIHLLWPIPILTTLTPVSSIVRKKKAKQQKTNIVRYHEMLVEYSEDPNSYMKKFENIQKFNDLDLIQPNKQKKSRKGTQFNVGENKIREVGKMSQMKVTDDNNRLSRKDTIENAKLKWDFARNSNFDKPNEKVFLEDLAEEKEEQPSKNLKFNAVMNELSTRGIEVQGSDEEEMRDLVKFTISKCQSQTYKITHYSNMSYSPYLLSIQDNLKSEI